MLKFHVKDKLTIHSNCSHGIISPTAVTLWDVWRPVDQAVGWMAWQDPHQAYYYHTGRTIGVCRFLHILNIY